MSDESTALVPIQEKQVNFYGDEITAVLVEVNGKRQVYVPVRAICEYLGLTWSSQFMRLKRDEVLAEALTSVLIMRTEVGQRYEVTCLQLEFLPGWLFGISTSRVRPDLQAKITRYRRECYKVLWRAFEADMLSLVDQGVITIDATATPTEISLIQVRDMGLAIARMAEQQLEQEQRLAATNKRLDVAGAIVNQMDKRLGEVERRISPPNYVTDEMATSITLAVKALAEELTRHDPSKNHYQSVYMEIYRRFRAPGYERIRIDKFEDVMKFLEDWQSAFDHSQQSSPDKDL